MGVDVPFVLTNGDRQTRVAGQLGQPVTLYLTVIVSPNTTTSSMAQDSTNTTRSTVMTGSEAPPPPTYHLPSIPMLPATGGGGEMSASENALREALSTTTNITRTTVSAGSETLSPPTDRLPSEM